MKVITLPKRFLLSDNDLKKTISSLERLIKPRNKEIAINFSKIEKTEKGDIMVLSAQLEKSFLTRENKFFRHGKLPANKEVKNLFRSGSNIKHVNKQINSALISDSDKAKLVNTDIIDSIVTDLKKIGIKEYYHPFNVFLTELIANAVEHGIQNKNINWWLNHEADRKEKIVKYTFVDMGVGIINSHKQAGLPHKYKLKKDKHIVIDSFMGKLGSSTKETNRGRGLPQLLEMMEKEFISDVKLITNKVNLYFENGKFICSKNKNFSGTYISWTIDQNNYRKWKSIK